LTFFLPSEYIMFAEEFKKKGGLWIMKPTARCQGSGIFIVDKLAQVAPFRHKPSPAQQVSAPPARVLRGKKEEEKEREENSSGDE
jgi:hypothetical protein